MFKKESTVKFWQVFFYTNTWFGYLVTLVIQHIYTITGNAKKKHMKNASLSNSLVVTIIPPLAVRTIFLGFQTFYFLSGHTL